MTLAFPLPAMFSTISNIKENAEEEAKKTEEALKNCGEWHSFRFHPKRGIARRY